MMMQQNNLKMVQINLHHSKAASDSLLTLLTDNDLDIALVQEPWQHKNKILGLKHNNYNILAGNYEGKIRTCILAKKCLNIFFLPQLSNEDLTVAKLEGKESNFVLISAYFPYEYEDRPPVKCKNTIDHLTNIGLDFLIGIDANAHHTQWGSKDINDKGETLFDHILQANLELHNRGHEPTFVIKGREEVIDITLSNSNPKFEIGNWRVSKTPSFSDHRFIVFDMSYVKENTISFRNPSKTNFKLFEEQMNIELTNFDYFDLETPEKLDKCVNTLTHKIVKVFHKTCPLSKTSNKQHKPWWNTTLKDERRAVRKLYNKAKSLRVGTPERITLFDSYYSQLRTYKNNMQRAKRVSWQAYCESVEDTTDAARLRKVLSKTNSTLSYIQDSNKNWTISSKETLDLLIDTHFPGNIEIIDTTKQYMSYTTTELINIPDIISTQKVKWAIMSHKPYKSPGTDGIYPILLQTIVDKITPIFTNIFTACLTLGYIPDLWKEVKVSFIPKAGKPSHVSANDLRPISLTPFSLKTMERLLDLHIRGKVGTSLSSAQHAYCKGRSVDSALHQVVSTIEKSIENKECTLAAFLDIEGAFNNLNIDSIITSLDKFNIDKPTTNLINAMLTNRNINSELGNSKIRRRCMRGTPQGGVVSPLLWNLTLNEIIKTLNDLHYKTVAYADDVVILITGKTDNLTTISELMTTALKTLYKWTQNNGLNLNPTKTELVLFTRKTKIPIFRLPILNNTPLTLKDKAKYLGTILDRKLNFKANTDERIKKACNSFYACKKAIGKNWGFSPKIIHWIYTSVVRPVLTNSCFIWWLIMEKECNRKKLNSIQRMAATTITKCLKSTPTSALEVLLDLIPLDIYTKMVATNTAQRLNELNLWKNLPHGHSKIISPTKKTTDIIIETLTFKKSHTTLIPPRLDWENQTLPLSTISIYTDGSKTENGTGSGVYSEFLNFNYTIKLDKDCSVFQAEIKAVEIAAKLLITTEHNERQNLTIYVDSQAAIKALASTSIKSKTVQDCLHALDNASSFFNITICWVPGHTNVLGNEKADILAKTGSENDLPIDDSVLIPFCNLKSKNKLKTYNTWNQKWTDLHNCENSRHMWPRTDKNKTKILLNKNISQISLLTRIITGHCELHYYSKRKKQRECSLCRKCKEEDETIEHILCSCPALATTRLIHLGHHQFVNLREISTIPLDDIMRFAIKTGCFTIYNQQN